MVPGGNGARPPTRGVTEIGLLGHFAEPSTKTAKHVSGGFLKSALPLMKLMYLFRYRHRNGNGAGRLSFCASSGT